MKHSVRCRILMLTPLILGAAGAFLRSFYFKNSVDESGFLIPGQPAQILFWVLAAGMLLLALLLFLKAKKASSAENGGIFEGIVKIFLGLMLAASVLHLDPAMHLRLPAEILGAAAALALLADGILRCMGKDPGFYGDSLFCLFLIIYMIALYTLWRSIPEMERFLTSALALLLLTPFACEMAYLDFRGKADRKLLLLGSLSCFFAVSSIGCPGFTPLHLGAAVYTAFGIWKTGRGVKP